jgi:hypothetical protein
LNAGQILTLKASLNKLRAALIFYKNQEHEEVQKCIKEVISALEIILGEDNGNKEN